MMQQQPENDGAAGRRPVRGVSVDAGGTLLEPWPSVGHVYAGVAREWGARGVEPEALTRAFGRAWRERGEFDYSRAGWRRLVDRAFADMAAATSGFAVSDDCFEGIYEAFARASAWRVYPDVLPMLEGLRARGVPVVILSNWDERLHPLVRELGLRGWVREVVVSCDVGVTKPGAAMFARAAEVLGVDPGEVLHVGDSETEDWRGARAAGLQAAWLRRSGPSGPGEVGSLTELLAWCDGA